MFEELRISQIGELLTLEGFFEFLLFDDECTPIFCIVGIR